MVPSFAYVNELLLQMRRSNAYAFYAVVWRWIPAKINSLDSLTFNYSIMAFYYGIRVIVHFIITFLHLIVSFVHFNITFIHSIITFLHEIVLFVHLIITFVHSIITFLHEIILFVHLIITFLHLIISFVYFRIMQEVRKIRILPGPILRCSHSPRIQGRSLRGSPVYILRHMCV